MLEIDIAKLHGHEGARPPATLIRSIQEQGFLAAFPIIVAAGNNGTFQILDGRRRTAAAEKIGLEQVLGVLAENSPAMTILAHATRSENPVAELQAYQALMRAGMSAADIARAGYASLQRVRKISKLTRLIPPIAHRVEGGEIAPSVAFQISCLAPEVQAELAKEEKVTGAIVRAYRSVARKDTMLATPGLEAIFQPPPPATIDDVIRSLSPETLQRILSELPEGDRFVTWRGKIRQALVLGHAQSCVQENFASQTA